MPEPARFTVTGVHSGAVFAERVWSKDAAGWAHGYVTVSADMVALFESLDVGAEWSSHSDARGIIVRRVA